MFGRKKENIRQYLAERRLVKTKLLGHTALEDCDLNESYDFGSTVVGDSPSSDKIDNKSHDFLLEGAKNATTEQANSLDLQTDATTDSNPSIKSPRKSQRSPKHIQSSPIKSPTSEACDDSTLTKVAEAAAAMSTGSPDDGRRQSIGGKHNRRISRSKSAEEYIPKATKSPVIKRSVSAIVHGSSVSEEDPNDRMLERDSSMEDSVRSFTSLRSRRRGIRRSQSMDADSSISSRKDGDSSCSRRRGVRRHKSTDDSMSMSSSSRRSHSRHEANESDVESTRRRRRNSISSRTTKEMLSHGKDEPSESDAESSRYSRRSSVSNRSSSNRSSSIHKDKQNEPVHGHRKTTRRRSITSESSVRSHRGRQRRMETCRRRRSHASRSREKDYTSDASSVRSRHRQSSRTTSRRKRPSKRDDSSSCRSQQFESDSGAESDSQSSLSSCTQFSLGDGGVHDITFEGTLLGGMDDEDASLTSGSEWDDPVTMAEGNRLSNTPWHAC